MHRPKAKIALGPLAAQIMSETTEYRKELSQIPCLSKDSQAESNCHLSIGLESLKTVLSNRDLNQENLLKMLLRPKNLSEEIGGRLLFDLSEADIFKQYHEAEQDISGEALSEKVKGSFDSALSKTMLMLNLDTALKNPKLQEVFQKYNDNLSLENISVEIQSQKDPELLALLGFLDDKFEFILGEAADSDYANDPQRPALQEHFD